MLELNLDRLPSETKTDFLGPRTYLDEEDVIKPHDLAARNVEYRTDGQVRTRRGIGEVWNPGRAILSMFNWIQSTFNRLVYLWGNGNVTVRNLTTGVEDTLISGLAPTPSGMICAQVGQRIIMTFFGTDGFGVTEGRVWDGLYTSGIANIEKLFPRALQSTDLSGGVFAISEPFPGVVTAGIHKIGVIIYSRNGAAAPPGIQVGGLFTPVSHNSAADKSMQLTLTPSTVWPVWMDRFRIIMTTVDNPDEYFIIPDIFGQFPPNSSLPVTVTINIADSTLALRGDPANPYFDLYSQNSGGTGPFSPYYVCSYNNRMVYLTLFPGADGSNLTSGAFISDPDAPQYITLTLNLIQFPEFKIMTCAQQLGPALYIFGPDMTIAYTDNLGSPASWPPPRRVDSKIGSPFPRGVALNEAKSYLWVGSRIGLFCYRGGVYDALPSSFHQTDQWNQINWAAPKQTFWITEDVDNRLVKVYCAWGAGQTTTNRLLVWDYSRGYNYDRIKYCGAWYYSPVTGIGAAVNVLNPTNGRNEIWMSSLSPGKVHRHKLEGLDATNVLYNDDGAGIDSAYKCGSPIVLTGPAKWVAASLRIRGAGSVQVSAYTLDQERSKALAAITAEAAPGHDVFRFVGVQSEACSIEVTNGAQPNAYFLLSRVKLWWNNWLKRRTVV